MAYQQPKEQLLKSKELKDYNIRVIVAGSRGFSDKILFHEKMINFLEDVDEPVLFISGAAPSGADDLIIRWCKRYGYPCKEQPADWDKYGRSAGFKRNVEMAKIATHLIVFYDGISPGTTHMLEQAEPSAYNLITKTILIKSLKNDPTNHKKDLRIAGCAV